MIAEPSGVWRGATWEDSFFENRLANNPVFHSVLRTPRSTSGAGSLARRRIILTSSRCACRRSSLVCSRSSRCGDSCAGSATRRRQRFGFPVRDPSGRDLLWHPGARVHPDAAVRHPRPVGRPRRPAQRQLEELGRFGLAPVLLHLFVHRLDLFSAGDQCDARRFFLFRWISQKSVEARGQLAKLAVVGVFTAMLTLQAMLPVLVQADKFLKENWYRTELRGEWVFDAWNHFLTGTDLPTVEDWVEKWPHEERPGISQYIFGEFIRTEPSLFLIDFVIGPALLLFGLWAVWRRNSSAGWSPSRGSSRRRSRFFITASSPATGFTLVPHLLLAGAVLARLDCHYRVPETSAQGSRPRSSHGSRPRSVWCSSAGSLGSRC